MCVCVYGAGFFKSFLSFYSSRFQKNMTDYSSSFTPIAMPPSHHIIITSYLISHHSNHLIHQINQSRWYHLSWSLYRMIKYKSSIITWPSFPTECRLEGEGGGGLHHNDVDFPSLLLSIIPTHEMGSMIIMSRFLHLLFIIPIHLPIQKKRKKKTWSMNGSLYHKKKGHSRL